MEISAVGELGDQADWENALIYGEKGFWQNPFSVSQNIFYTELLMLERKYDIALETCSFLKKIDLTHTCEFRTAEIFYYSQKLKQAENIFRKFEEPLNYKVGALFYIGMIAAQNKDTKNAERILTQVNNLSPGILIDCEIRKASIYFGLNNEQEGFNNLDIFFNKPLTKKLKHYFGKYLELDPNFSLYLEKIRSKYFETKHLD